MELDDEIKRRLGDVFRGKRCCLCNQQADRIKGLNYLCNECREIHEENQEIYFNEVYTSPFVEDNCSEDQNWRDFIHDEPQFEFEDFHSLRTPSGRRFRAFRHKCQSF